MAGNLSKICRHQIRGPFDANGCACVNYQTGILIFQFICCRAQLLTIQMVLLKRAFLGTGSEAPRCLAIILFMASTRSCLLNRTCPLPFLNQVSRMKSSSYSRAVPLFMHSRIAVRMAFAWGVGRPSITCMKRNRSSIWSQVLRPGRPPLYTSVTLVRCDQLRVHAHMALTS